MIESTELAPPLPWWLHRCRPATRRFDVEIGMIEMCPCGATRLNGGDWMGRNSRRWPVLRAVRRRRWMRRAGVVVLLWPLGLLVVRGSVAAVHWSFWPAVTVSVVLLAVGAVPVDKLGGRA